MKPHFSLSRIAASAVLIVGGGLFAASSALAQNPPPVGGSGGSGGLPATIYLKHNLLDVYGSLTLNGFEGTNPIELSAGMLNFTSRLVNTAGSPQSTFASYCVEPGTPLGGPSAWIQYDLGTSVNSFTPLIANRLASLYSQYGSSANTLDNSVAFQTAVWEITNENTGPFDVTSGNFRFTSTTTTQTALATANSWLSTLVDTPSSSLSVLRYNSINKQDLLVITSVPEPESYALMLAGLGLMLTIARRRSSKG